MRGPPADSGRAPADPALRTPSPAASGRDNPGNSNCTARTRASDCSRNNLNYMYTNTSKLKDLYFMGNSSHSNGASPAIWDHTVYQPPDTGERALP